jgi:hypothetical protein
MPQRHWHPATRCAGQVSLRASLPFLFASRGGYYSR